MNKESITEMSGKGKKIGRKNNFAGAINGFNVFKILVVSHCTCIFLAKQNFLKRL